MPRPTDKIREIGELKSAFMSKSLRKVLEVRQAFWQTKVNEHVKAQNLIEAYAALARLEDIPKIMDRIQERLEELQKQKEE